MMHYLRVLDGGMVAIGCQPWWWLYQQDGIDTVRFDVDAMEADLHARGFFRYVGGGEGGEGSGWLASTDMSVLHEVMDEHENHYLY